MKLKGRLCARANVADCQGRQYTVVETRVDRFAGAKLMRGDGQNGFDASRDAETMKKKMKNV